MTYDEVIDEINETVIGNTEVKYLIVSALVKQVPMKPNHGMAQGNRRRSCPACFARVINTYKFCDQCGQKLDWGRDGK